MTAHPFEILQPEYERRIASLKITRSSQINRRAMELCEDRVLSHYLPVQEATKVPVIFQATTFERESGTNFNCSPAQGDPFNRVSTHVPRDRGPYSSWISCAIDTYTKEHVGILAPGVRNWTAAYFCWKLEAFNGFGPRDHGRVSGYVFAGTDQYDPPTGKGGKYVADGKWDGGQVDKQLGALPLAMAMIRLRPELALPGFVGSAIGAPEDIPVLPTPVGVGGEIEGWTTKDVQAALNTLHVDGTPLTVDGNAGRRTRAAVRAFQSDHGLDADGLAGPKTITALKLALAAR